MNDLQINAVRSSGCGLFNIFSLGRSNLVGGGSASIASTSNPSPGSTQATLTVCSSEEGSVENRVPNEAEKKFQSQFPWEKDPSFWKTTIENTI
jgi:hypothetical protein